MCIGLFKCSFYIGGMEGKYQVLWRKVRWGKKETFPGFSPKDRRSNLLSEYFAQSKSCIFWKCSLVCFCLCNCTIQRFLVYCHRFTGASIRPRLRSAVHLLASSVNCWKVFIIYSFHSSHMLKYCRLTISFFFFFFFSVSQMEACYMEITAPICFGINQLSQCLYKVNTCHRHPSVSDLIIFLT